MAIQTDTTLDSLNHNALADPDVAEFTITGLTQVVFIVKAFAFGFIRSCYNTFFSSLTVIAFVAQRIGSTKFALTKGTQSCGMSIAN